MPPFEYEFEPERIQSLLTWDKIVHKNIFRQFHLYCKEDQWTGEDPSPLPIDIDPNNNSIALSTKHPLRDISLAEHHNDASLHQLQI